MENTTAIATNENVSNYIHDDITFSIISKLPLKSFKRFECVRKLWSLLSENHHFMNMFRDNFFSNLHSCSYYDQSSLILKVYEPHQEVLYFLSGQRFENKVKLDYSNPSAHPFDFRIFGFGSINGTLCLHEYDNYGKIVLWNPSTQAIKFIPLSLVELVESSISDAGEDLVSILMFCLIFMDLVMTVLQMTIRSFVMYVLYVTPMDE
ncbi:putative F-box domain-containing protein [Medicago truncatula]|uniref:Putative F-box domain-containing protein n=1 Tax=Medicago truncatula TaxID=3880 RepID=A0A396HA50_MEDTR|nr:putative F-box domain-containing protein [Medicago truncatula]